MGVLATLVIVASALTAPAAHASTTSVFTVDGGYGPGGSLVNAVYDTSTSAVTIGVAALNDGGFQLIVDNGTTAHPAVALIGGPTRSLLEPGEYSTMQQPDATHARLSMFVGNIGGDAPGTMTVHEITWDAATGLPSSFAASYTLAGGPAGPVGGELRFNSALPYRAISADKDPLNLGAATPSAPTTGTVSVTNIGTDDLSMGKPTISGDSAASFSVLGTTCPADLVVGASCTVDVTMVPVALGTLSAFLEIPDGTSRGTRSVPLAGYGRDVVAGTYVPVTMTRILDTRKPGTTNYHPRLGPGEAMSVRVPVAPFSPGLYSAVVVNLTVTHVTAASDYLTLYAGAPRPPTSSINVLRGQTRANLVTVPVGPDGRFSVYNRAGTADVVIDVVGMYSLSGGQPGAAYEPLIPGRIFDSRWSDSGGPLLPGDLVGFGVPNYGGEAVALAVNVTTFGASGTGYLQAWAGSGVQNQLASIVNYQAGHVVANMAIIPLADEAGTPVFTIANPSYSAQVGIAIDVVGVYLTNTTTDGLLVFHPVDPTRLVDTRSSIGMHALGAGRTGVVDASTVPGVGPDARALVMNATLLAGANATYISQWPDGVARPLVSNVNADPYATIANMAMVDLSIGRNYDVFNSAGTAQVLNDISGYFAGAWANLYSAASRAEMRSDIGSFRATRASVH